MPQQAETQAPTRASRKTAKKRAKRNTQQAVETVGTAVASGTTHPHRKSDVLPAEVQAAQENTTVKEVKKARRAARKYAKRHQASHEVASPGTVQQQIDRFKHPEPKSYDIFVDKAGHPEHFSDYARPYVHVLNALTGHDPNASEAKNLLNVGTNVAELFAGGAAGKVIGDAAKARAALKVNKARTAAEAESAARSAKAAEDVAQASSKAGRAAKRAKAATTARYAKQARKLRRAEKLARHAHSINPVTGAAAATKQGGALIQGTGEALNPSGGHLRRTLETTARTIPASLAYPATAAYDIGHTGVLAAENAAAAIQGKTPPHSSSEVLGPVKGAGKELVNSFTALEPLVSGNPEKVRKATENQLGLVGAPLIPAFLSKAHDVTTPLREGVAAHIPKREIPDNATKPGPLRKARQVAGSKGRAQRRHVKTLAEREMKPARGRATRHQRAVEEPLRKAPHTRSFHNLSGMEAGDVVPTLARFGISRHNPHAQLEHVLSRLNPAEAPKDITTVRNVLDFATEHPEVLASDATWESVKGYKERATETSQVAKFRAQGDVLGVTPPEHAVPPEARRLTDAENRGEAWQDFRNRSKAAKALRRESQVLRARAQEAKGARRAELLGQSEIKRAQFHEASQNARELGKALDPYSRPGQSLEGKRIRWTAPMAEEYAQEVKKVATEHGFEDPAWVSEPRPGVGPENVQRAGPGPRAQHVKTGESARLDIADRSLRALVSDSIWRPQMQAAIHRFVNRVVESYSIPYEVNGHKVFELTDREYAQLVGDKVIDRRETIALPSRDYKQAVMGQDFSSTDLTAIHSDIMARLKGEIKANAERDGGKYIVLPREVALELADQLNPTGSRFENVLSGAGTVGSRVILFSAAWEAAQIVAEGLQMTAAEGPLAITKAVRAIRKLRRENPKGAEALDDITGVVPPSLDQPGATRVSMDGGMHGRYVQAGRALRRTFWGRALYNVGTLKLFGILDRWKGGKYRQILAVAHSNKEFHGFLRGLTGSLKTSDEISQKLAGMSDSERLAYEARHPRLFEKNLDYVDDMMGNYGAYSRFEKEFGPLVMFLPYIRMSLRWTFWSYPKGHPVKAQILYFLAQQNSNEIDKLLGPGTAKFVDYAMPIIHGTDAKPSGVLPGGQRFGAPGLNAIVQAVGEDNYAGLLRVLSPAISLPIYFATGLDPMSGEQTLDTSDLQGRALLLANQLLSLSPLARFTGVNDIGAKPKSAASKVFEQYDPNRDLRSFALPFLPQSAHDARKEAQLSHKLDVSGAGAKSPGEFIKQAEDVGLDEAISRLKDARKAGDYIKRALAGAESPTEEKRVQKILDAYYAILSGGGGSSSGGLSGGGLSGGGLSGGGLSGGGLGG